MQVHGYSKRILTRLKREPQHILRNGVHVRMVDLVNPGDTVTVILQESSTIVPNPALSVPVIYEDDDVIVFDKPGNMPVHPSLAHYEDTLANFFMHYTQCKGEHLVFRPVNRLDRNTRGLCLAAKNALAAKKLSGQLHKEYTAVACGDLGQDHGIIDAPIGRVDGSLIERQVCANGQPSKTEYRVLARSNGYTMVRVILHTGRTHQIRVHFSHIGFPLAGDDLYGGNCADLSGQALSCTRLHFIHPVTGIYTDLRINMHSDLVELLK